MPQDVFTEWRGYHKDHEITIDKNRERGWTYQLDSVQFIDEDNEIVWFTSFDAALYHARGRIDANNGW